MRRIRYLLVFGLGALALLSIASPAPSAPENVIPIGQVQGVVADTDNGLTHRSPFAPASGNSAGTTDVTVRAVVTQKTLARTSAGAASNGIFIQNTTTTADTNANTSDGIFVFMGVVHDADPRSAGAGVHAADRRRDPHPGPRERVLLLSQLSSQIRVEEVIRTGVNLATEVPSFEAEPPDDLAAANRYWERHEGMRVDDPDRRDRDRQARCLPVHA